MHCYLAQWENDKAFTFVKQYLTFLMYPNPEMPPTARQAEGMTGLKIDYVLSIKILNSFHVKQRNIYSFTVISLQKLSVKTFFLLHTDVFILIQAKLLFD